MLPQEACGRSREDLAALSTRVVVLLGQINHGKTTILDRLSGRLVAPFEAGGATQNLSGVTVVATSPSSATILNEQQEHLQHHQQDHLQHHHHHQQHFSAQHQGQQPLQQQQQQQQQQMRDQMEQRMIACRESQNGHLQQTKQPLQALQRKYLTFIDTPGHASFETLRGRASASADIACVVIDVAAGNYDLQTEEALLHADRYHLPVIFALNKCDKLLLDPSAAVSGNVEKYESAEEVLLAKYELRRQCQRLQERGLLKRDLSQAAIHAICISALYGYGMKKLFERLWEVASSCETRQLLSACSTPKAAAEYKNKKKRSDVLVDVEREPFGVGIILEIEKTNDRGLSYTILVKRGRFVAGSYFVAGSAYGRIRSVEIHCSPLSATSIPEYFRTDAATELRRASATGLERTEKRKQVANHQQYNGRKELDPTQEEAIEAVQQAGMIVTCGVSRSVKGAGHCCLDDTIFLLPQDRAFRLAEYRRSIESLLRMQITGPQLECTQWEVDHPRIRAIYGTRAASAIHTTNKQGISRNRCENVSEEEAWVERESVTQGRRAIEEWGISAVTATEDSCEEEIAAGIAFSQDRQQHDLFENAKLATAATASSSTSRGQGNKPLFRNVTRAEFDAPLHTTSPDRVNHARQRMNHCESWRSNPIAYGEDESEEEEKEAEQREGDEEDAEEGPEIQRVLGGRAVRCVAKERRCEEEKEGGEQEKEKEEGFGQVADKETETRTGRGRIKCRQSLHAQQRLEYARRLNAPQRSPASPSVGSGGPSAAASFATTVVSDCAADLNGNGNIGRIGRRGARKGWARRIIAAREEEGHDRHSSRDADSVLVDEFQLLGSIQGEGQKEEDRSENISSASKRLSQSDFESIAIAADEIQETQSLAAAEAVQSHQRVLRTLSKKMEKEHDTLRDTPLGVYADTSRGRRSTRNGRNGERDFASLCSDGSSNDIESSISNIVSSRSAVESSCSAVESSSSDNINSSIQASIGRRSASRRLQVTAFRQLMDAEERRAEEEQQGSAYNAEDSKTSGGERRNNLHLPWAAYGDDKEEWQRIVEEKNEALMSRWRHKAKQRALERQEQQRRQRAMLVEAERIRRQALGEPPLSEDEIATMMGSTSFRHTKKAVDAGSESFSSKAAHKDLSEANGTKPLKKKNTPVIPVILRSDAVGTFDVLLDELEKLQTEFRMRIPVVHGGIGPVIPRDVVHAEVERTYGYCPVYAFRVPVLPDAVKQALATSIVIKRFDFFTDVIADVRGRCQNVQRLVDHNLYVRSLKAVPTKSGL